MATVPLPTSTVPGAQTNPNANPYTARLQASGSNETQMLTDLMPYLNQMFNANVLPSSLAQLGAAQATSGPYAQLMTDLYKQYGPQLNAIGNQISGQNMLAQVGNERAAMQGGGNNLALAAQQLQQQLDPQFYATRAAEGGGINALLSDTQSHLGGNLSPTELNAVQQGLARSNQIAGMSGAPSQTNVISNAMNYGAAGTARQTLAQNQLASAIQQASAFLPASQSGINGFNIATGQNQQSNVNAGNNLFTGVNTGNQGNNVQNMTGATAGQLGSGYTNQLINNQNLDAQKKDWLDQFVQFSQGLSNIGNSVSGASKMMPL